MRRNIVCILGSKMSAVIMRSLNVLYDAERRTGMRAREWWVKIENSWKLTVHSSKSRCSSQTGRTKIVNTWGRGNWNKVVNGNALECKCQFDKFWGVQMTWYGKQERWKLHGEKGLQCIGFWRKTQLESVWRFTTVEPGRNGKHYWFTEWLISTEYQMRFL